MNIRHQEIEIPTGDPFYGCVLDRKKYASILSSVIKTYSDGFVLALNSEWGTGKTTFVKMWRQQLENDGYSTLYFNAWENDFDTNPLTAILAEFKKVLPKNKEIAFNSLLKKGAVLAQNILPGVVKAVAKRYVDIDEIHASVEGLTKAATEILKDEIKSYTARQKGLSEFKQELQRFVVTALGDKPFVFFIDELDRCKPSYAVELLEQVKHFFSVPGIVFVLSIDKIQLGHCIRGAYGSEMFNTEDYLKRFIDLEFTLPEPNVDLFCQYLFKYFNFKDFFDSDFRVNTKGLNRDGRDFIDFSASLFSGHKLTLRQQEKLFAQSRVGLLTFEKTDYVFPSVYLTLVFARAFHSDVYNKLKNIELPVSEVLSHIRQLMPSRVPQNLDRLYEGTEALMVLFYVNAVRLLKRGDKKIQQYDIKNISNWELFPDVIENSASDGIRNALVRMQDTSYSDIPLTFFFKHIEMIDDLKPS
ncbi:MAG: P-loop NTPase fold protein [Chitinophagaceae bacterium]